MKLNENNPFQPIGNLSFVNECRHWLRHSQGQFLEAKKKKRLPVLPECINHRILFCRNKHSNGSTNLISFLFPVFSFFFFLFFIRSPFASVAGSNFYCLFIKRSVLDVNFVCIIRGFLVFLFFFLRNINGLCMRVCVC